jgi:hypothetical protein
MRYKNIYRDGIAATIPEKSATADFTPADVRASGKCVGSESLPACRGSEVVCWPAGYVGEMRASLTLMESHLGLLLHGTPSVVEEHSHAYVRKIQHATDKVRILAQSKARISVESSPADSRSKADQLPALAVIEICESLRSIEHDLAFLLHEPSLLLAEHRKAFLRRIQDAVARLRINLHPPGDHPKGGAGERPPDE